jgi:hypothetical protein
LPTLTERIQKAWNAFRNKDPTPQTQMQSPNYLYYSGGSSYRPDTRRFKPGSERSIITPILNRISVDAAAIEVRHVRLDKEGRYKEDIKGSLNELLTTEANIDQTAREFRKDVFASLLDEGYIAVCPINADVNYVSMTINEIGSARVGKIQQWHPKTVDVELYNEETGQRETVPMPKSLCLILQNPFYEIMNAPNSLMARLRRKLALLDKLDEEHASGKLDMIIQLPYSTRHETNQARAEQRKKDIEMQLNGSKYGIAYIDANEKIIQLNKPLDSNLQSQIESLQKQLHDQLGVSPEILNGSADEAAELNYVNNIIEPLVSALTDEMRRKWLTKTARSQGQSIMFFRDPFRLVPVGSIADLGDKLIRNQILSANEMRGILGFKPSDQPGADDLRNPNMPFDATGMFPIDNTVPEDQEEDLTGEGLSGEEVPTDEYSDDDTYTDAEEEYEEEPE